MDYGVKYWKIQNYWPMHVQKIAQILQTDVAENIKVLKTERSATVKKVT